ncbi:ribonuclease H-like domain-containing protein [Tanacetum coccineum]
MPPNSDLVYPSLDDFVDVNESVVKKPTVQTNEPETSRKENGAPIIKDWVSDSDEENVPKVKTVKMFNKPSFDKINFVKSIEQVKSPRKTSVDKNRQNTPSPRGNKRNWNQQMSQKLESDFEMFNKACHVCGSFDHLKNDCNNWSGPISVNVVRPINTVQSRTAVNNPGPIKNVINNAYSTTRMPFNKITTGNNSNFTKNVNIVKGTKVNTARPKAVLSTVMGNKGNVVKASHETDPILQIIKKFDGGYVAFEGNSKGGKINWKGIENLIDLRVKVIRCDNGTEFKNRVMNQFCEMKGIKREFSVARTPQQNRAEAVNTTCYVQNRVLVIKPHNKTPYELFLGRKPALSFMRPFGCPVTILNPYITLGNQSNSNAATKACDNAGKARMETVLGKDYILLPMWHVDLLFSQNLKESPDAGFKPSWEEEKIDIEDPWNENAASGKA